MSFFRWFNVWKFIALAQPLHADTFLLNPRLSHLSHSGGARLAGLSRISHVSRFKPPRPYPFLISGVLIKNLQSSPR